MSASSMSGYPVGAALFIADSAPEFIGVRLLDDPSDPDRETVRAQLLYTAGIPGYEVGGLLDLSVDTPVYDRLTVSDLVAVMYVADEPQNDEEDDGEDDGEDDEEDDEG